MPCPGGAYALLLPAWPELGVSAAGVKGGGSGAGCWPAPGRRRCELARLLLLGGGSWASSALAQLLPAVALGPALLPVPAPRLDTRLTHALLLATSFLPATAAAPSLTHHPVP